MPDPKPKRRVNSMGREFSTSIKITSPVQEGATLPYAIGPKRTYGKNSIGRGFFTDANVTTPQTSEWMSRASGNGAMKINDKAKPFLNTPPAAGTGTRKPNTFSKVFNKIGSSADELSPYISNISNAFRKAPRPTVPIMDSFTNLSKIDLSNERHAVKRTTDAANKATERNVDSSTAEAIKAFNRGQEFNQLSSINERENNTNIGIGNQQAMMDAQVKASNTERRNDYGDAKTAADIADVRERSANVANAGDKFTLIQNEKRKASVERDKVRVLSSLYNKSGVLSRQARQWKKMGIEDPLGMGYSYSESDEDATKRESIKKYGGMMQKAPSRKLC